MHMKRFLIVAMVLALVLGAAGTAAAATVGTIAEATGSKAEAEWTVSGTVTSVNGNEYVISDGAYSIAVEFGPRWYKAVDLTVGEAITVTGEVDRGKAADKPAQIDAYSVTRADTSVIEVRTGPGKPPWAGRGGPKGKAGGVDAPDDDDGTEVDDD
jgi:uncharacterized protein YdeI (BOF family)